MHPPGLPEPGPSLLTAPLLAGQEAAFLTALWHWGSLEQLGNVAASSWGLGFPSCPLQLLLTAQPGLGSCSAAGAPPAMLLDAWALMAILHPFLARS